MHIMITYLYGTNMCAFIWSFSKKSIFLNRSLGIDEIISDNQWINKKNNVCFNCVYLILWIYVYKGGAGAEPPQNFCWFCGIDNDPRDRFLGVGQVYKLKFKIRQGYDLNMFYRELINVHFSKWSKLFQWGIPRLIKKIIYYHAKGCSLNKIFRYAGYQ